MKKSKALVPRKGQDRRTMLERILDTPNLEHVVPRLQSDVLHRVIQTCGLEKCGQLVMLTTPGQLTRILDLDLWRSREPGMDEQFDADRFGVWLEVLADCGDSEAAQKLAEMDGNLVIAGLAQHARVFDVAAATHDHGLACEVGGYRLFAKRADSWDAIVTILISLAAEHPDYFHQVMRGCRALSNSGYELDGLDDLLPEEDQTMFDLALEREQRREDEGYVAPAQARAFLEMSRRPASVGTHSGLNCKFESRIQELAYLANTIMAGCSLQGRPFAKQESKDAAVATCKLGLENLPKDFLVNHDLVTVFQVGWTVLHRDVGMYAAEQLLGVLDGLRCDDHNVQTELDMLRIELSKSFQAGMPWRARDALDVIAILDMPAWAALLGLIDECPVLHAALRASRDPQTRSVSASAFEFISQNSQIASIHEFLEALPETLRP